MWREQKKKGGGRRYQDSDASDHSEDGDCQIPEADLQNSQENNSNNSDVEMKETVHSTNIEDDSDSHNSNNQNFDLGPGNIDSDDENEPIPQNQPSIEEGNEESGEASETSDEEILSPRSFIDKKSKSLRKEQEKTNF